MLAHDLPHVLQCSTYQYTLSAAFGVPGIETAEPHSTMSADVPFASYAWLRSHPLPADIVQNCLRKRPNIGLKGLVEQRQEQLT